MRARASSLAHLAFLALLLPCGCGARSPLGVTEEYRSDDPCAACPAACIAAHCRAVTQVAAGGRHTCARLETGTVSCWGANDLGILGTGKLDTAPHATPTVVPGVSDAVEIAVSETHACARLAAGTVACWGLNDRGQLGHADGSRTPTLVSGVVGATHVAVGRSYSCASTNAGKTGKVLCWGRDDTGQLGDARAVSSVPAPIELAVPGNVQGFSLGPAHGCLDTTTGEVWCWGANQYGQLGNGRIDRELSPPHRVAALGWVTSTAAEEKQTCAARVGGVLACWGGDDGALFPNDARNAIEIADVALGAEIDCVRTLAGKISCGTMKIGDFGTPTFEGSPRLEEAATITVGYKHACALLLDGAVHCLGDNAFGQLGDGTTDSRAASGRVIF